MNKNQKLFNMGQSLWYDNIQRGLIESGELKRMIDAGEIYGITSNPSIFMNAIAKSNEYDAAIQPMALADWSPEAIFWQLAVEDIRSAADLLAGVYEKTNGSDGYISLEVDPTLANDTEATIKEAKRLWDWVNRPNLCVKIPATKEGLPAIRASIAAGINVNVTLLFSPQRYDEVIDAYLSGLEDRLAAGHPIDHIHSVASVFVSRIDGMVDPLLREYADQKDPLSEIAFSYLGKVAVANSHYCYKLFKDKFSSPRFETLEAKGANLQRPLWASTGLKDPSYSLTKYVDELIAPNTVNTANPTTLNAYQESGSLAYAIEGLEDEAQALLQQVEKFGIDLAHVYQTLEQDGVKAFADSFAELLAVIDTRKKEMQAQVFSLAGPTAKNIAHIESINAPQRMVDIDPTLWTDDPEGQKEIKIRLGWLDSPFTSMELLPDLQRLAQEVTADGYTHCILLGMGGSSLAPEVIRLTLGMGVIDGKAGLDLAILDSTDPDQVQTSMERAPLEKTLVVVASKSGSTAEVHAFMEYYWQQMQSHLTTDAGRHFVVITDPGSSLVPIAEERGYRAIMYADPNVGGRFSAMTSFGLVPAALMGLDVADLLTRAQAMAQQCSPETPAGRNPGLVLGALIGSASLLGRDKLSIITDPAFASLGSWLEQLIAESSGKEGKGIVPVDNEPVIIPPASEQDRLYVYIKHDGTRQGVVTKLRSLGHPVLTIAVPETQDLLAEFYRWETAIAYACMLLEVNTFDQPNVQLSKTLTKDYIKAYHQQGSLDLGSVIWENDEAIVYGDSSFDFSSVTDLNALISRYVSLAQEGDYVAINAYLPRNAATTAQMENLRESIAQQTRRAVTLGFGPRFQHSTGQLHKGGKNNILLLYITKDPSTDFEVPGQDISFATLAMAQALGDMQANLNVGRRAIRVHLK
ncbi:MAG TPA: bifunctional transaldolase/phosoglucose isomerase [Chloroflexi bacterium]|nr:bifunctional transaldolase/phosoglucose isomerase [Chloroflexota bacterium]